MILDTSEFVSQRQAALLLGVPATTMSRLIRKHGVPTIAIGVTKLVRLADVKAALEQESKLPTEDRNGAA